MESPTKTLYVAGKPGKNVVTIGPEIHFWPAHDYQYSYLGSSKKHKGHNPDTLRLRSTGFECTSSGYPKKWKDGLQLRRVGEKHFAAIQEIEQQQKDLADRRQALLNEAWRAGELVHVSEAANYQAVTANKSKA
jgi:hypothetical protein